MGAVQGWSIVGTVTSNCHDSTCFLQQADQPLFVRWTCTRHHLQVLYPLKCLFVTQGRKLHTRYRTIPICRIVHNTCLTGYFQCCGRRVACHYFYIDTGTLALANGTSHLLTQRITDGDDSQQRLVLGNSQRTHGMLLPIFQTCFSFMTHLFAKVALCHHYLWCTFYIYGITHRRRHVFPFR